MHRPAHRPFRSLASAAITSALLALCACGSGDDFHSDGGPTHRDAGVDAGAFPVGRSGGADVVIGNWNMEWFGSPDQAPSDDNLQQANATAILQDAGVDVWGLVEVVDTARFAQVVAAMPGYTAVVSSDPTLVAQPAFCGTSNFPCYDPGEQKPALMWRSDLATLQNAQLILTDAQSQTDFAGRSPLRVDLRVRQNDVISDLTLIVVHMKANTGNSTALADAYQRRINASVSLKAYLDANLADRKVIVLGDFNDDTDESIYFNGSSYPPSPYANFLADPAHYLFPTQELTDAGFQSTVTHPNMIDQQLVSDELAAFYEKNSAVVIRPDLWTGTAYSGSSYGSTTTDHYPVAARYALGVADAGYLFDGGTH